LPVVKVLQSINISGDVITFTANFPYAQFKMNGLTIAAVTNGAGPFIIANTIAQAAIFSPSLIEI
jgi:hypothetical protein